MLENGQRKAVPSVVIPLFFWQARFTTGDQQSLSKLKRNHVLERLPALTCDSCLSDRHPHRRKARLEFGSQHALRARVTVH
jgi:hypothetical protein